MDKIEADLWMGLGADPRLLGEVGDLVVIAIDVFRSIPNSAARIEHFWNFARKRNK